MNRITKNNFLQYLIAVAAACLVFGIMQGTKDSMNQFILAFGNAKRGMFSIMIGAIVKRG